MRFIAGLMILAMSGSPASAGPDQLNGDQLRRMLSGNSIINPEFGCVFYRPDGTTLTVAQGGQTAEGEWQVRGDRYYSSGQCGEIGCRLTGSFPSFTFQREDGGYEQNVILILGNYCEKDGIVS